MKPLRTIMQWVLRYTAVCANIFLVGAWVASIWWQGGIWARWHWVAVVSSGQIIIPLLGWDQLAVDPWQILFVPNQNPLRLGLTYKPRDGCFLPLLLIPLWLILLTTVPVTVWLWRAQRQRLPGHCRKCAYNLTGNVSGNCPECGTPIPEQRSRSDGRRL